jgi:hypothetical protein
MLQEGNPGANRTLLRAISSGKYFRSGNVENGAIGYLNQTDPATDR